MITEIRKSINSIFADRVTSPFYGTLLVSWTIWNWKIIYLTLFVDQDKISENKIDFIISNYADINNLVTFPLVSTIVLLTIIPFLTNGAYWLDLKFTTWRRNKKNQIEGTRLLTVGQSIGLRTEIRNLEDSFEKLLERKNEEIAILKSELEKTKFVDDDSTKIKTTSKRTKSGRGSSYGMVDYNQLKNNAKLYSVFEKIAREIKSSEQFPKDIDEKTKEYYLVNEIVDEDQDVRGNNVYFLTFKGEGIYKEHFNRTFAPES